MKVRQSTAVFFGLALLSLGSCASTVEYQRLEQQNRNLQESIDDLNVYLKAAEDKCSRLERKNKELSEVASSREELEAQKARLRKLIEEFGQLRPSAAGNLSKGVEVIRNDLGEGFRIEGKLLFPSGRTELTAEGKKTLASLMPLLRERRQLRIVGHTDTDPIKHSDWKSNLDLSSARAVAVAEELRKLGVAYEQMSVMGFGSARPASDAEPRDKAKDRRVEIYLVD
ncbi:MAG: hypothetical protein CSA62_14010 [Planctomycetota bacterium]|nr:MAG: hypothetical protein CSA62_14010 [Planctomycetota bacterium]